MGTNISLRPKKKFLLVSTFFLSVFLIVVQSCRKTEVIAAKNVDTEAVFFRQPPSISPEAKRVLLSLQQSGISNPGLIETIASKSGFAVWDKAIVKKLNNPKNALLGRNSSANDTIVYIPLVLTNTNYVNAFIYAKLNGTATLWLYNGNDYQNYSFGNIADSSNNAEKLALQVMILDKEVFGHSSFRIKDSRFFNSNFPVSLTNDSTKRILHLSSPNANNNVAGARFVDLDITICTTTTSYHCTHTGACSGGTCDNCSLCQTSSTNCTTTKVTCFVTDDDQPSGGTPLPTGDGGGGGPTTGNPHSSNPATPTNPNNPVTTLEGFEPILIPEITPILPNFSDLGNYIDDPNYYEADNNTPITFDITQNPWFSVSNVISLSDFVPYDYRNCLDLAKTQIAKASVTDLGYGSAFKTYTEQAGVNTSQSKAGINYIISKLKIGKPVIIGVDNRPGTPSSSNTDGSTDHFVVIVGSGTDAQGNYFTFFDNATNLSSKGASSNNKLYYDANTGLISGKSAANPTYAPYHDYIVTQIRQNK